MQIDDKEFLKLKKQTFKNLLTKSEETTNLILSSLIISLCHDLCIKDENLKVSPQFINECSSKINLNPNINIDPETKFTLIRNKLAHGDYAYNDTKKTIIINYQDQYIEISLNNIIDFANTISNYYQYLGKEQERVSLIHQFGYEFLITDRCKKNKGRDYSYNQKFEYYIKNHFIIHQRNFLIKNGKIILPENYTRKSFSLGQPYMDIDCEILSPTDKKTDIIYNPYGDKMLKNIINLLNNKEPLQKDFEQSINMLINFYIFYIYPLDNFMKLEDQGIKALPSDTNFDFSKLNLNNVRNDETFDNVGKIKNYKDDLVSLYKKIHQLETKLNNLMNQKYKGNDFNKIKLAIETEIEELLNITLSGPISRLYEYSKNRSLLEHIRCSIMHGNYDFNEQTKTYTFFDYWKNSECYHDEVSLSDFNSLFNFENMNLVLTQDKIINERKR